MRPTDALRERARHIATVVRAVTTRRDTLPVAVLATTVYLGIYLLALRDLRWVPGRSRGGPGPSLFVVENPLVRAFEPGPGPYTFEPVALVSVGPVRLLLSPGNLAIGLALSILVGVTLGVAALAARQPRACGVTPGVGPLAALPALLGGGACCAPTILLATGVTAGAGTLAAVRWLLPVGVLAVLAGLAYLAGKIDATAVRAAGRAGRNT